MLKHTLIRRNEDPRFLDPGMPANRQASMQLAEPLRFRLRRRQLPEHLPKDWQVRDIDAREVEVSVPAGVLEVLLPDAQLPGFARRLSYPAVLTPRAFTAVFTTPWPIPGGIWR
ncbi:hypothetical protein HORIV_56090 [Vreelandella olivaria]|uniref:Uncharacterized protein n=1 Tax=Vreelandella olivaria TaxID=390919 RepID=A0ABM7GQY4_9GAMM|nr:hypothetical protein HORIV_56090 [Halomonas olivaria]